MRLELVEDWMTRDVITATPEMGLLDADKLMRDKGIRRLPVVDADGRLQGMITYGDVRGARPSSATALSAWEMNYLLANLTVSQIMKPDPITVDPHTTIGETAQIMLEQKISGLPVVAKGTLVGIITESDIFRMVVHDWMKSQKGPSSPYAHYENE